MPDKNCADRGQSFEVVLQSFLQDDGLPFSEVLTEQEVEQAFEAEGALFGKGKRAV